MFAGTSAAFICCEDADLRNMLHHPITSHNANFETAEEVEGLDLKGLRNGFLRECRMIGTHDYAPMLAVPAALNFFKKLDRGVEGGLASRNRNLALEAGKMLAAAWGTSLGVSEECVASTVMVGLPACFGSTSADGLSLHQLLAVPPQIDVLEVTKGVWDSITIQVPIPAESMQEGVTPQLYVRLSAAAYNHIEEYEVLRDVILRLVKQRESSAS
jgi:hypothetical protein